jgi:ATP-dependent DNA helicase RecG
MSLDFGDVLSVGELLLRLPEVGPWAAGDHERDRLDLKETPETAGVPRHALKEAAKRFRKDLVEDAVCFANARGGWVVIGVRDRASEGQPVIAGVDLSTWAPDEIKEMIYNRTRPHLLVDVAVETILGAPVLLVRIPQGEDIYGTADGVFKYRQRDACVPLDEPTMRALRAARGRYDWTAEPTGAPVDVISRAALEEAAARLRSRGRDELAASAELDAEQYLRDVGLLTERGLTRAAVLLYGTEAALRTHIPNWGILLRTAPTPGSEGTTLLRRDDARRPLVLLLDDVLDRLALLTRTETIRAGAEQVELVDYPPDASRELLANAFAHRDWEAAGVVEVLHSSEELTITSPGGLLPTLNPDRLLRETAARNPLLTREMARLGLAEQAGLGFDRVYRELARIGKPPPQIVDGPHFTITLAGGEGDSVLAKYVASGLPNALRSDVDVLLLLALLRDARTVTATTAAGVLQRTTAEAQRVLERMRGAALIEPTKGTARRQNPSYRLAPSPLAALRTALGYRTQTIDSDDQKLIRHLQRNGRISNADVRDYLDCDTFTARNRLTRFRKKGWIDFAPESPRLGPDVSYVKLNKLDADVAAEGRSSAD